MCIDVCASGCDLTADGSTEFTELDESFATATLLSLLLPLPSLYLYDATGIDLQGMFGNSGIRKDLELCRNVVRS